MLHKVARVLHKIHRKNIEQEHQPRSLRCVKREDVRVKIF